MTTPNVRSFDFRKVSLIFGAHVVRAYMDESSINAEPVGEGVNTVAGADGDVARSINTDQRWRITVQLLQSSDSNNVFSAAYNADNASGGMGVVPCALRDNNGLTLLAASSAWVVRPATVAYGRTVTGREWIIEGVFDSFIGASGV
ncbi:major tail protein [Pseudomonas phage MiCath]|uniref:Major tail protein n=1 Tax=Pseudomonas phage MiCath TaxID=3003729 RepID=A0A9Y1MSQ8_9CAUD|nr:major tail protein [Pseudomonas phage MiCath]WAX22450.1 major tail protein [Pseudomonas phage MiCath]